MKTPARCRRYKMGAPFVPLGRLKRALQKGNAPTGESGRSFIRGTLYSKTRICQVDNLANCYLADSLRLTVAVFAARICVHMKTLAA